MFSYITPPTSTHFLFVEFFEEKQQEIWESFLEVFVPRIPEIFQTIQNDPKKVNAIVQILRVIPCHEWSLRSKKEVQFYDVSH